MVAGGGGGQDSSFVGTTHTSVYTSVYTHPCIQPILTATSPATPSEVVPGEPHKRDSLFHSRIACERVASPSPLTNSAGCSSSPFSTYPGPAAATTAATTAAFVVEDRRMALLLLVAPPARRRYRRVLIAHEAGAIEA